MCESTTRKNKKETWQCHSDLFGMHPRKYRQLVFGRFYGGNPVDGNERRNGDGTSRWWFFVNSKVVNVTSKDQGLGMKKVTYWITWEVHLLSYEILVDSYKGYNKSMFECLLDRGWDNISPLENSNTAPPQQLHCFRWCVSDFFLIRCSPLFSQILK